MNRLRQRQPAPEPTKLPVYLRVASPHCFKLKPFKKELDLIRKESHKYGFSEQTVGLDSQLSKHSIWMRFGLAILNWVRHFLNLNIRPTDPDFWEFCVRLLYMINHPSQQDRLLTSAKALLILFYKHYAVTLQAKLQKKVYRDVEKQAQEHQRLGTCQTLIQTLAGVAHGQGETALNMDARSNQRLIPPVKALPRFQHLTTPLNVSQTTKLFDYACIQRERGEEEEVIASILHVAMHHKATTSSLLIVGEPSKQVENSYHQNERLCIGRFLRKNMLKLQKMDRATSTAGLSEAWGVIFAEASTIFSMEHEIMQEISIELANETNFADLKGVVLDYFSSYRKHALYF